MILSIELILIALLIKHIYFMHVEIHINFIHFFTAIAPAAPLFS